MASPRTNQTPSVSALPWRILKAGNKAQNTRKYSPDVQLTSQQYTAETLQKHFAKDGNGDSPDTKYIFVGESFLILFTSTISSLLGSPPSF